jgi:hypothetical protein
MVHVSRDLGLLAFNLGIPEQTPAVSGVDVALVRDLRIAVLHTLLTAKGRREEESSNECR